MTDTVYSKARRKILQHGWRQGAAGNKWTGYCAIGAVSAVYEEELGGFRALKLEEWSGFYDIMLKMRSHLGEGTEHWNDHPDRTKGEVLDLFQELHEKELAQRGLLGEADAP